MPTTARDRTRSVTRKPRPHLIAHFVGGPKDGDVEEIRRDQGVCTRNGVPSVLPFLIETRSLTGPFCESVLYDLVGAGSADEPCLVYVARPRSSAA